MTDKLTSLKNSISNKPATRLAVIAGASGLIYLLVFTLRFPLARFYATIPPIDYTKLTNYSLGGLMAYVIGIGLLFELYLQAIRLAAPGDEQKDEPAGKSIISASSVFFSSTVLAVISIFSYPLTAIDLLIYAIHMRGWALYGLNPMSTAPKQLPPADPWLKLAGEWIDAPSPYGPVWEWLSLGTFYLSGGDFLPHLLALKILAGLAYLGCAWLVYKILQQLRPEWAIAGLIAFAWNPLVLLESVQNGHNDIVMTFFLLAAVWAFVQMVNSRQANDNPPSGHRPIYTFAHSLICRFPWAFVCLFLALSILVKFVTIITVPFFLLGMAAQQANWPRRLASMLGYGLIIGLLVVLPILPFWPGWENWAVLRAGSHAGRSLLALLVLGLRDSLGLNFAFDLSHNFILAVFALIYLYYIWHTIAQLRQISSGPSTGRPVPPPGRPSLSPVSPPVSPAGRTLPVQALPILPSFFTLFWYVLLAAPVFHAWYLLWFLPLAVLLRPYRRRPLIATIVFSITALLIIPYFETIRVWYPFLLENQFVGHLIGIPLLIGPPIIALLWPIGPGKNGVS